MEDQLVNQRPGWVSATLIVLSILGGFIIIGPLVGFLLAIPFMHESLLAFTQKIATPEGHPELKTPLLIIQSCTTFVGLAVVPSLYWWTYEKRNPLALLMSRPLPWLIVWLVVGIVISFMVFNSFFIEWNSSITFPEFLGGFDSWARETERMNEKMVKLFTTFSSFGDFAFSFLTMSVLAGFCEELAFRGMLQPQLYRATNNIHVAIWITAILFSSLHVQFFGFVPRVFLGALFGYLYYWSGNLAIPMLAHMVNNGIGVVAVYLHQQKKIDMDPENTDSLPLTAVAVGAIVVAGLLFFFYRFYRTNNAGNI